MKRREFLASSAAFALAQSTLFRSFARAQTANSPSRFVFIVEGNCVEPVAMLSEATRSVLDAANTTAVADKRSWYRDYAHDAPITVSTASLSTARSLSALAGGGGLSSLEERAMVVYGLSSKITGGGHSTLSGALTASRPNGAIPTGPSIDAALAKLDQVRGATPFEAVRLGIAPNSFSSRLNYATCAIGASRPAPLIVDPTTAYNNLFGSVDEAYQAAFEQRTELIDIALTRTQAKLSSFKADCDQRRKLMTYEESLQELYERQNILESMKPALTSARDSLQFTHLLDSSNPNERLMAQFEMATAALVSGLTHVVVIGIGTGGEFNLEYPDYVIDNVSHPRHDTHHLASGDESGQPFRDVIHDVSAGYVEMAATMARTLEGVPEGGGTMLDNTAIVYLGGNGEQHHSSASEFPLLVIGGQNMGLKTDGRTVVYPGLSAGPNHRQLSSFFTTLSHAAGAPIASFGNEGATLISEGPLGEVWSS